MPGPRNAVLTCKCGAHTHAGHQASIEDGFPPHTYGGATAPDAP